MRLPFRKSEADRRAAALRGDLEAARAQLAAIDTRKAAAQTDSVAFAKWTADRNAAALEVDRQSGLIEAHETDVEQTQRSETEAAERRARDAARKAADDLMDHFRVEGPRIYTDFLSLTVALARQSLVAKELNERLPDGEPPIPVVEIAARDFGTEPREEVRWREVDLWVSSTGAIIGDQAAVASDDGVHGQFHVAGGSMRWKCIKRCFREIEFRPGTVSDWPAPSSSCSGFPDWTAPGLPSMAVS